MRLVATLLAACFGAALIASASVSAQTFQKKSDGVRAPAPGILTPTDQSRPKPNATTTAPKGKNMVPLTAADCTDLGGSIHINTLCNSRFSCARTDQNGKTYHVCVNGK